MFMLRLSSRARVRAMYEQWRKKAGGQDVEQAILSKIQHDAPDKLKSKVYAATLQSVVRTALEEAGFDPQMYGQEEQAEVDTEEKDLLEESEVLKLVVNALASDHRVGAAAESYIAMHCCIMTANADLHETCGVTSKVLNNLLADDGPNTAEALAHRAGDEKVSSMIRCMAQNLQAKMVTAPVRKWRIGR